MKKYEHMSWSKFDSYAQTLVQQIQKTQKPPTYIFGIPRGGLPLATYLSNHLGLKMLSERYELNFMRSGLCLLVDDISDSGQTLQNALDLTRWAVGGRKIATLYWRTKSKIKPDFFVEELKDDRWIILPWEPLTKAMRRDIDTKYYSQDRNFETNHSNDFFV